jgi:cell wall-associated NlpC family hydrolase
MTEAEQRAAVVAEAQSWRGTKWHHEARLKGVGVDCGQYLIAVFSAVGLVEVFEPEHYDMQWNLHRSEAKFLAYLLKYTRKIDSVPLPADIVMFRYGRQAAHGAIVVSWPTIIHAFRDERMVTISDLSHSPLSLRIAGIYRLKDWA